MSEVVLLIGVAILAGYMAGMICKKINQPQVVGWILAGVFSRSGWSKIFAAHVKDIMTTHPKTINLETHTVEALDTMLSNDLRLLPVVEEDKLMGIISHTDIAKNVQVVSR